MDISGLGASGANAFSGFGGTDSLPPSVQAKIFNQTQSLSLLPSVSSPGLGAGLDIYAAVNMQNMGMLAGGRAAVELANISLGIDPSAPSATHAAAADTDGDAQAGGVPKDTHPGKNPPIGATLDKLLKEAGFTPQTNPYEFRSDFFADEKPADTAETPYYSNPGLSNPSLGGLLDSLG